MEWGKNKSFFPICKSAMILSNHHSRPIGFPLLFKLSRQCDQSPTSKYLSFSSHQTALPLSTIWTNGLQVTVPTGSPPREEMTITK